MSDFEKSVSRSVDAHTFVHVNPSEWQPLVAEVEKHTASIDRLYSTLVVLEQGLGEKASLGDLDSKADVSYCEQILKHLSVEVSSRIDELSKDRSEASISIQSALERLRDAITGKADRGEIEALRRQPESSPFAKSISPQRAQLAGHASYQDAGQSLVETFQLLYRCLACGRVVCKNPLKSAATSWCDIIFDSLVLIALGLAATTTSSQSLFPHLTNHFMFGGCTELTKIDENRVLATAPASNLSPNISPLAPVRSIRFAQSSTAPGFVVKRAAGVSTGLDGQPYKTSTESFVPLQAHQKLHHSHNSHHSRPVEGDASFLVDSLSPTKQRLRIDSAEPEDAVGDKSSDVSAWNDATSSRKVSFSPVNGSLPVVRSRTDVNTKTLFARS